jgi:NTP pyrophosphatase (non-canonical NTP hydrolase)
LDQRRVNHELADCLWSVLVLARKLDVDIERAFWTTMLELDNRLDGEFK